jgi:predicted O-methyltransferase YrrM
MPNASKSAAADSPALDLNHSASVPPPKPEMVAPPPETTSSAPPESGMNQFQFTNNWFANTVRGLWDQIIPQIKPTKPSESGMNQFQFTNNWFANTVRGLWDQIIPQIKPTKILEVGCYEGASTCFLIQKLAPTKRIEIHCVDTWEGGIENKSGGMFEADMNAVFARFKNNIKVASDSVSNNVELVIHKGFSDAQLSKLLASGKNNYFDFVYIDGSHQAPDVLCDAVLSFRLLKVGGVMAFDDYLWAENLPGGIDPIRCPKPAIDAFTNIYCRKIRILSARLLQLYVQKLSD